MNGFDSAKDPRTEVTPDAFSVAPELLGTPLARPWRRGAAMAIDLLAISLLTRAGGFFLGLAAALLFLRMALFSKDATATRTWGGVFGCLGIGILLITLAAGYDALTDSIGSLIDLDDAVSTDSVPFGEVGLDESEEGGFIRWLLKIADEVGIGFGWSGIYFTLFIALFKGRTPGKRLLGI